MRYHHSIHAIHLSPPHLCIPLERAASHARPLVRTGLRKRAKPRESAGHEPGGCSEQPKPSLRVSGGGEGLGDVHARYDAVPFVPLDSPRPCATHRRR